MQDRFRIAPQGVFFIWLAIVALCGALIFQCGIATVLPGPFSKEALYREPLEKLAEERGIGQRDRLLVILSHKKVQVTDPEFIAARESLYLLIKEFKNKSNGEPLFRFVQTVSHTLFSEAEDRFIGKDSRHLLIKADSTVPVYLSAKLLSELPVLFNAWQKKFPGFSVSYLSSGTVDNEIFSLINSDLDASLLYTLPITLLILLYAFRTVVAAIVPLFMAGTNLVVSLGITALLSHWHQPVSATAAQLVVLFVLALGIDYALFFISRVRESVSEGQSYQLAISNAQCITETLCIDFIGITRLNTTICSP